MSLRHLIGCSFFVFNLTAFGQPEAFQIGPRDTEALPGGKEADGIIGDFVLRNDLVEAVISHKAPHRRANMSTYYGVDGITPGCLYDLALRESDNDQLTIFAPLGQRGEVSFVRIADPGESGTAVIETEISSAINQGILEKHDYHLSDGWQGLLIISTITNETNQAHRFKAADEWKSFGLAGRFQEIAWGDAVDPADKAGYAHGWVEEGGGVIPDKEVNLKPGETVRLARFIAVGNSPAEAVGLVASRSGEVPAFQREIVDPEGKPVTTAAVHFIYGEKGEHRLPAYPDEGGNIQLQMPKGASSIKLRDFGRETVDLTEDGASKVTMTPASRVRFVVRDAAGTSLPCKAQFIGLGDTKTPNLGPNNRAHGCVDQYHSETGAFTVQLDPGRYRVRVTRGIEYSHHVQEVQLGAGEEVVVSGVLERLVDTDGWVSADFHNHSTPSGDNTCGTDDRLINLAAEHLEFAPTTEHNRMYDWRPHIEKLGLTEFIQTVPGLELTGSGAHFNSFPFEPKAHVQDGGAPVWQKDPRLNAIILRDFQGQNPDRWVQINHPDMTENFIDRDADGRVDGGFLTLGKLVDGVETQNYLGADILLGAPYKIVKESKTLARQIRYVREFIWLQLLNQGYPLWAVAVADAHTVYGNGVGSWRNYLPSSTDDPSKIDWREMVGHAKAGRMICTSGPFLSVETSDGTIAGGSTRATGAIDLKVKVQCTDWLEIDRIQVLVNGAQVPTLNFTKRSHPDWFSEGVVAFEQTLTVPLSQDSHLIVVAYGENSTLEKGYGTSTQASVHPCAYNNPIFVDVDGGGFTPNGDTLGFPLPVKNLTIGEVQGHLSP